MNRHKAWFIKSGEKVRIFRDEWVQSGVRLWNLHPNMQDIYVQALLKEDLSGWDGVKLAALLSRDEVKEVKATQFNQHLGQDEPFWPYTKDGGYSVKTGYHLALNDLKGSSISSSSNGEGEFWQAGMES